MTVNIAPVIYGNPNVKLIAFNFNHTLMGINGSSAMCIVIPQELSHVPLGIMSSDFVKQVKQLADHGYTHGIFVSPFMQEIMTPNQLEFVIEHERGHAHYQHECDEPGTSDINEELLADDYAHERVKLSVWEKLTIFPRTTAALALEHIYMAYGNEANHATKKFQRVAKAVTNIAATFGAMQCIFDRDMRTRIIRLLKK